MNLIIYLLSFLFLMSIGFFVGGFIERNHLQALEQREAGVAGVLATQVKSFPLGIASSPAPTLLVAETVVSSDYLKSFLAGLRGIFGGEIRSFRTIMERARREAVVQLKEQAAQSGYNAICNIRIETADVAGRGANQKNKIVMASILASGTAYVASSEPRHA